MAALVGREKPGGQPKLPLKTRLGIRSRLRRVRYVFKAHLTDEEFARAVEASEEAVYSWLRTDKEPVTPNTTFMVKIARCANVQPTWLLQGVGPELLGTQVPIGNMAESLHGYVKGVLASELRANEEFVERLLPESAEILEGVLTTYRSDVEEGVRRERALRHRLAVLTRQGAPTRDKGVLEAALYRLELQQLVARKAPIPVEASAEGFPSEPDPRAASLPPLDLRRSALKGQVKSREYRRR